MANKKITELVELLAPTSADLLPIVNGGITKKVSISTLAPLLTSSSPETQLQSLSAKWENSSSIVQSTSGDWNSVYSTVQANSSTNWNYQGTDLKDLSGNWQNTYTEYRSNSASYTSLDFVNSKFFPLSGGLISGNTRINGNVTIFGDLTSTGTQTFANTIFSTTSALSVVHVGSGPAVWVGNNGSGDIASFNDIDQGIEVLHIGGINGDFPNVGVKTSAPNKDFTVSGEISATGNIWTSSSIVSQEVTSLGSISATGVISASASNIKINVINSSIDRIFTDEDNNKVVHIDTTTGSLSAIFPSDLSNGFNVAIMNTGTNSLVLSAAQLNSAGTTITTQYGGAFVYKDSNNLFAVGKLV